MVPMTEHGKDRWWTWGGAIVASLKEDFRFHDALLKADFWILFAVTVINLE
jgi:hypothetical protein